MKIKEKKCKHCKELFTPIRSTLEKYCLKGECINVMIQEIKDKQWTKTKKEMKEKLETVSEKRNKLQKVFNEFIRLRDKGQDCISCSRSMTDKKIHAGHFYSVGRFPELRFNEDNCHAQCEWCNIHLHGNGALYRVNLEKRIGKERLEDLDALVGIERHFLKHEIEEMIDDYKEKIKKLKKNIQNA